MKQRLFKKSIDFLNSPFKILIIKADKILGNN